MADIARSAPPCGTTGRLEGAEDLLRRIDRLPRFELAALPTALQRMPRLGARVGANDFLVKRDDLTGLAFGGNKTRAMEFIVGDALDQGCDVFVAGGGVEQSNHARQCMAAANRAGMDALMVLQHRGKAARTGGNLLITDLLGGEVHWLADDPQLRDRLGAARAMKQHAQLLREAGRKPYVLASSVHPLSVVAYLLAALELAHQLSRYDRARYRIYAASEGAVLAGLALARKLLGLPWEVVGMGWRPLPDGATDKVLEIAAGAAELLDVPHRLTAADVDIRPTGGPAYGEPTPAVWEAITLCARLEGLILDPVYTGKGMAGVLDDLRARPITPDEGVVFVHTGGTPALFAYDEDLRGHLASVGSTPASAVAEQGSRHV